MRRLLLALFGLGLSLAAIAGVAPEAVGPPRRRSNPTSRCSARRPARRRPPTWPPARSMPPSAHYDYARPVAAAPRSGCACRRARRRARRRPAGAAGSQGASPEPRRLSRGGARRHAARGGRRLVHVPRPPGSGLRDAARLGAGLAALPARHRRRCRRRGTAVRVYGARADARQRLAPVAGDRGGRRRPARHVAGGAADLVHPAGAPVRPVRDAVLAAGAVRRLPVGPGLRLAAARLGDAAERARLERAGRAERRRGDAVRARDRRPEALLAAHLRRVRLARARLRRAGLRQPRAPVRLRRPGREPRQPAVPRHRGLHAGGRVRRLARAAAARRAGS